MTYYSVDEAREYARTLTDEALFAISGYEGAEILTEFAVYLLGRSY